MSTTPARPVYIETAPDSVFGFFHPAEGGQTAVLVCPPFGWDETASYRVRGQWADRLAEAGHPALRIDYPGTGDSAGSPLDPARLEAWTAATAGAARWLRAETGCARVVLLGIGLGGIVGHLAAAGGAPIDDLVLWGVSARGKTLLRELRAFARLMPVDTTDPDPGAQRALPEGYLEVAGFVISAETAADLGRVDLSSVPLPDAPARRVLMLERDGVGPDAALRESLEASGASVSVMPGDGFGSMTNHPQEARLPEAVVAAMLGWLGEGRSPARTAVPDAPAERLVLELTVGGSPIRERPFVIDHGGDARLFGVLTEPAGGKSADLAVVLANPGAIRRSGPNRMWVEVARRWAARGVPTLRFEVEGVGDSSGDGTRYADTVVLYEEPFSEQVRAALDELQAQAVANSFIVGGLCSSAYWAFHALVDDDRVRAGLLLNLFCFFWDPVYAERAHAPRAGKMLKLGFWRKLVRGGIHPLHMRRFARWVLTAPFKLAGRSLRPPANDIDATLDGLRDAGKHAALFFCPGEPLYDRLQRDGRLARIDRWPNVEVHPMSATDHMFRATWMQRQAHAEIDKTIGRELLLAAGDPAEAASAPTALAT